MAFNDFETSRDKGQPVDLYQFTYGQTTEVVDGESVTTLLTHNYTDGESAVVLDGVTYSPLPITRSSFSSGGDLENLELEITLPRVSEIADMFRVYPPPQVISVKIRQGHIPNSDDPPGFSSGENFPVAWLGRIVEPKVEGAEVKLTCEAASAAMSRPGLRRHYQWPCPLNLYGTRCRADRDVASSSATVAAISGNRVQLQAGWGIVDVPQKKYVGGYVEWSGSVGPEFASILRVDPSDWLVLSSRPRGLSVADTLTTVLGCNHTLSDCQSLHNNIINYGGQPFIPIFNPVYKNNHT